VKELPHKPAFFPFILRLSRGAQPREWGTTMIRIAALVVAAALFSLPAAAQPATKGKSDTAPGQTQTTPGQQQTTPGGAKDLAPGQKQTQPGGAKDLAPGSGQRKK
jgi:hypothetical protein